MVVQELESRPDGRSRPASSFCAIMNRPHVGKIARLSAFIREEIDHRLDTGQLHTEVLTWLNSLPEVTERRQTDGHGPITSRNLSLWRRSRGYVVTRTGKIARLPEYIREEVNRQLHDKRLGAQIVAWLNKQPDVLHVLEQHFHGEPITENNLSEWRRGGYRDWYYARKFREFIKQ